MSDALGRLRNPRIGRHVDTAVVELGDAFVSPSVRKLFGFPDWPNGIAQIDLGDRIVDVIPTPGHSDSYVSHYDRQTALLVRIVRRRRSARR